MALTALPSRRPSRRRDAAAFLADRVPDRLWKIEGLIEEGGRILLAGDEGSGKSFLMLTGAVQAAMGRTVWNRFKPELPRRTVYFDLENTASSVRRRLRTLTAKATLEPGALDIWHEPEGLDLASKRERQAVLDDLDEIDPPPDLLVFDPLYKACFGDINSEREVKPTLLFFDTLRSRYRCGVVIIHHTRKRVGGEATRGKDSSDILGSSVIPRWTEMTLLMNDQRVLVDKDRDDNIGKGATFPVTRGGDWPIGLDLPLTQIEEAVLRFLRDEERAFSVTALQKALHRGKQQLLDAVHALGDKDRVDQDEEGRWFAR